MENAEGENHVSSEIIAFNIVQSDTKVRYKLVNFSLSYLIGI